MSAEENYLDKLLKSITEPKKADGTEAEEIMSLTEETEKELVSETDDSTSDVSENADMSEISDDNKITDVIENSDDSTEGSELGATSAGQVEGASENDTDLGLDENGSTDTIETPDIGLAKESLEDELNIAEIGEVEASDAEASDSFHIDDLGSLSESDGAHIDGSNATASDELSIDDIDTTASDVLSIEDTDLSVSDELHIEDIDAGASDELRIGETEPAVSEDLAIEDLNPTAVEDAALEETDLLASDAPVSEKIEPEVSEDLRVEEAAPEPAEELNPEETESAVEELRLGELDLEEPGNDAVSEMSEDMGEKTEDKLGVDAELEDVLSMLDDDADLAEINDILKKSDSKEPIQDEMMDLLNQMADDEAEMVNAGVKDVVEDGGVPIPDMSAVRKMDAESEERGSKDDTKKKKKNDEEKAPGALGKFFNMLTEDLPGPTEADYAAEDEAKAAKKQEEKEKKEQEKLAKDEEKKVKAEEKAAAKKAKADAAAQKKKEKDAAKAEKAAAKKAKQQAEAVKKAKRIPPKKIVAVGAFGASVLGAVVVSTTILSNQGYINVAKRSFYEGDYKSAYLSMYGMELNDSDGLIQAKSEVILKMQCWYDSYQNNLKLNRQREALDALIHGVASYDYINADAEQYGVLSEVDSIKNTILTVLETEYGLSEAQVRELLNYEDALAYTMALNDIITGK